MLGLTIMRMQDICEVDLADLAAEEVKKKRLEARPHTFSKSQREPKLNKRQLEKNSYERNQMKQCNSSSSN